MRLTTIAIAVLLSGCWLVFDDGGGSGGGTCDVPVPPPEPAFEPAELRDPFNLTCQAFSGGGCDPQCGPCPLEGETNAVPPIPPIPTWGRCGSECEDLGETSCLEARGCRVVRDVRCAIAGDCTTDFLGCFPLDTLPGDTDCFTRDAQACSQSSACAAYHTVETTCPVDAKQCARPFGLCTPVDRRPGSCFGTVTCDRIPPGCPPDSRPGIANSCFTGSCIPVQLCEPGPL